MIRLDLYKDAVKNILAFFDKNIEPKQYKKLLKSINGYDLYGKASNLLRAFISYDNRRIPLVQREVFMADKLMCQLENEFKNFKPVVYEIANSLREGKNVNDRLSRKLSDILYEDRLLNDWRLYHFHLGKARNIGYCERTGALLMGFVPLNSQEMYLLEIIPKHDKNMVFANKEYLEIIHNNWPEIISYARVQGELVGHSLTMQQRFNLRNNGVNTIDVVAGHSYFGPGLGITTAGTSVAVQRKADIIYNWIGINTIRCCQMAEKIAVGQIPIWLNHQLFLNDRERRFVIKNGCGEQVAWYKY